MRSAGFGATHSMRTVNIATAARSATGKNMPPTRRKPMKDEELAAAIRKVATLHKMIGATGKVTSAYVIEVLHQRGEHAKADELENLVTMIKARRAARGEQD